MIRSDTSASALRTAAVSEGHKSETLGGARVFGLTLNVTQQRTPSAGASKWPCFRREESARAEVLACAARSRGERSRPCWSPPPGDGSSRMGSVGSCARVQDQPRHRQFSPGRAANRSQFSRSDGLRAVQGASNRGHRLTDTERQDGDRPGLVAGRRMTRPRAEPSRNVVQSAHPVRIAENRIIPCAATTFAHNHSPPNTNPEPFWRAFTTR